jgi:predicted O-methyltransferase YrrM
MFGNKILDIVFAPWAANVLYCANRLKLFTVIVEKDMTLEELATALGAVPRYLKALLDGCIAIGLLQLHDNRYKNSYLSDIYLVEGRPTYLGDIIEVIGSEAGNWDRLYGLITGSDETGLKEAKREVSPHRFTLAMNNLAMQGEAGALAAAVDLSGCKNMVDVGCGSGVYSIFLCRRYPDLNATLMDMKDVIKTTQHIIETNNLQDRIKTCEADITKDSYGDNHDVVLLSDVLYQEKSFCLTILQSAYKALVPGGILLVRGYYSDPGGSNPVFGSLFNLARLLDNPQREFISVSLLSQWIAQVGFKIFNLFPLTERSVCIMANRSNLVG